MVKLRFLVGLARMIAMANGMEAFPQVRETLGQLAAEAAMVDAFVYAMEVRGQQRGAYFVPDRHTLYAAQVLTQQLYPKVITTLRSLAGGSMIMLPSGIEDFADPKLADYVLRVQGSASLDAGGAREAIQAGLGRSGSASSPPDTRSTKCFTPAPILSLRATPTAPTIGTAPCRLRTVCLPDTI